MKNDDEEEDDPDGTEEMFEVDGGTEYQEIPLVPETSSSPETIGLPSEHIDPVVKRKRRNRRKNKDKKKTKICPPEEVEEILMRNPRHVIVGPPVTNTIWGYI